MTITPAIEADLLSRIPTGLFIGGEFRSASDGGTFEVHDPSTGLVLLSIADATPADGAAALAAADEAQRGWARTAPRARAEILRTAFELLTARAEDFALLMTLEMGKPLAESRGEVAYGAEFLRWFSEETARISGRFAMAPDGNSRLLVTRRAVGPCLFITPWNFPLAMATRKIAPAIAAGCTMVLKPAALTPLTALFFTQLLQEAGLPAGVLNVVQTSRAGAVTAPLIADSRLRKLSFTGSTEVGRRLIADAASQVLRVSMELGGNAPFLVFADADIDRAVDGAMIAKFRNIGQACTAANRFIVHESVAKEFAQRVTERVRGLKIGRGTEEGVGIGPLINAAAVEQAAELVQDAIARGAIVLTGGARVAGAGSFYEPTVLSGVAAGSSILHDEIFGPVLAITTFTDEADAVAKAHDTEYGLVSYVYTRDLASGQRLIESIQTGMMGLNVGVVSNAAAPFGGVKQSGVGREGGLEGIHEYLETKYVLTPDPFA